MEISKITYEIKKLNKIYNKIKKKHDIHFDKTNLK